MEKIWLQSYPSDISPSIEELSNNSILDLIQNASHKYSQNTAFTSLNSKLSFKDVEYFSENFGAYLQHELSIEKGSRVAIMLPNLFTYPVTLLGCYKAAATVININPLYKGREIENALNDSGAETIIVLDKFIDELNLIIKNTKIKNVIVCRISDLLSFPMSLLIKTISFFKRSKKISNNNYIPFSRTISKKHILKKVNLYHDDIALLQYTGGTTGMPKVAQHTYSGMIYNGWLGHELLFTEEDNVICPLPLFHVFACHVILMAMVSSGAHVVFPTPQGYRGDGVFDNFWKLIERWQITFVITVPTAISALMQRPVDADISSVKTSFSGSAPLPLELFRRFEEASGVTIVEGYGLTEATCLVSCNPVEGEKKVGSVGLKFPYTDIKIIKSEKGNLVECKTDEVGEICISNPGVYAGNTYTEADKNADLYYKKKYLRTGDLGRKDSDEYLWITGRAKDLIIRGGHNIDPAIVEEALLGHEAIAFAGAIGQPDQHSGELPCVYVELVGGATVTPEELDEFCKEKVKEPGALPKHIEILEELPKTAVGKVFKPDLRMRAIMRVFSETLDSSGVNASITSVDDDKKLGLVANISSNEDDETINQILGDFTIPWQRASN